MIRPLRRSLSAIPALCAAALAACSGGSDAARLNVLLITLDTTRPDHMGCYGAEDDITPNIDRLAADGARFERAISTAGITPMSHASILTGLNNYRHGMRVFYSEECSHRLKDSVDTLPEILAAKGYRTAGMVSAYVVSEIYNLDQGFQDFDSGVAIDEIDISHQQKHATEWDPGGRTNTQRRGDFTVDAALSWLEEKGTGDDPWCLWVHMFDVHDFSLVPPPEHAAKFGITYPPVGTKVVGMEMHQWRERMYDPELNFVDLQVGRLLDWLRQNDQYDDTIVVITADHGQGLMDGLERHGWPKHRLLYDWCIRVPLIVRIPGEEAGLVVSDQVRTIDILPTLLEALDVGLQSEIEGLSLLPLMHHQSEPEPRMAYADALNLYDAHSPKKKLPRGQRDNMFAVTDGVWKLIWKEHQRELSELYHLAEDPLEANNLWSPEHPQALRLEAFLEEKGARLIELPTAGEGPAPSAEFLKNLGYVDNAGDAEEETGENEPR